MKNSQKPSSSFALVLWGELTFWQRAFFLVLVLSLVAGDIFLIHNYVTRLLNANDTLVSKLSYQVLDDFPPFVIEVIPFSVRTPHLRVEYCYWLGVGTYMQFLSRLCSHFSSLVVS